MQKKEKIGFMISPWAAILLYITLIIVDPIDKPIWAQANIMLFLYVVITAYLATAIFAIPSYLICIKTKIQSIQAFILGGAAIGFLVALVLDMPNINLIRYKAYGTSIIAGILSATTLWMIIRRDLTSRCS